MNKKVDYIWKDRKRFLGMPLSFTRYALSDDRLFLSTGCLSVRDEEILLYRIRDISLHRTLGQRLCGVGTITIHSSDKSTPVLQIKNVKHPYDVKELLHQSVESCKQKRRLRLNEMMTDIRDHCDHCDDGADSDDFDEED